MFVKNYRIGNEELHIYCEIEDYCDILSKRLLMFEETNRFQEKNYIKIYKNQTIYQIGDTFNKINGKIDHTDLFPLFNNVFANLINSKKRMLIHSAFIYYNNLGVLILGDFSSGKSTLCKECNNLGFKILSTDQSIIKLEDEVLWFERGSKYMKVCDGSDYILDNNNFKCRVDFIINLLGVCDNGVVKLEKITNKAHYIKRMFKYITWHSDVPLLTDKTLLEINRNLILDWMLKLNVPLYNVRGDVREISNVIKEMVL